MGIERFFHEDQVIVTKTDRRGIITYANRTFLDVSEYAERQVLGKPHSVIRHPDMPRCIFKLLWETLAGGREMFAYVLNRTALGNHYWVFAHVTPSLGTDGAIRGYHSNRRVPDRPFLEGRIIPLYRRLLDIERQSKDPAAGIAASSQAFDRLLADQGVSYDQYVFGL